MWLALLIASCATFWFGYYLGQQIGRTEHIRAELRITNSTERLTSQPRGGHPHA